jgi:hypothetical protein
MPQRICKTPFEYAKRKLRPGERFDCEANDVRLLFHLGWIEPEPGERGYVPRDLTAAAPHTYQTRDLLAGGVQTSAPVRARGRRLSGKAA